MNPNRLHRRPLRPLPLAVTLVALAAAGVLVAEPAHAELLARGPGMVYDSDTNLTWLLDWNQAAGSAWDDGTLATDGKMSWASAKAWAEALDWGGHADWRLPETLPCLGFNCTGSEMGQLWYVELGNLAGQAPSNLGPFTGVQLASTYWTGTHYQGNSGYAYYFGPGAGGQSVFATGQMAHAVAVRVGDVSPVPEPGSAALALAGLLAVGRLACRRRASSAA